MSPYTVLMALALLGLLLATAVWRLVRMRKMQYWLGAHLRELIRPTTAVKPRHVYFCFADHYEPYGGKKDRAKAHARVQRWCDAYPAVAARHHDSSGRPPQHSYFYPAEEYDPELLDQLAAQKRAGLGDVEVHLHHDNDTAENLRHTLTDFVNTLDQRHGLLRRDASGRLVWVFIHGNWALDNSRPDGRWCGVDNELSVLVETGCVADMTLPSAPSDTQTGKINSIYAARGKAGCRKQHDHGRDMVAGAGWLAADELLMVQGPLTLNWREGKAGILPRIESAELSYDAPPTPHRVALWGRVGVHVEGAGEHVFIKVHTHGATEKSMDMLFDRGGFDTLWTELERQYRDVPGCELHYVSAWEMVERIHALANPGQAPLAAAAAAHGRTPA